MDQHPSAFPEQARKFAPEDQPREDPTDEAGRALIAMLEQAASLANENCKGPTEFASKIVRELRAAEDRIKELEAVVSHYHERAKRAEDWLQRIEREIEDKLIAPRATSHTGLPGTRQGSPPAQGFRAGTTKGNFAEVATRVEGMKTLKIRLPAAHTCGDYPPSIRRPGRYLLAFCA
jgi:hypothetical protein